MLKWLKRHHVQIEYADPNPYQPSLCGTRLHPLPDTSAESDAESESAAVMAMTGMYGALDLMDAEMQHAILADAAAIAAANPNAA